MPARLDPDCIRLTGCRDIFHGCLGGCDAAADEPTALDQEMEPAEPECGWNPVQATTDCDFDRNCPVHGVPRPPFLVAYATGSGALNELALPGEASVAVVDGSLVISHASGVLGIASVKPLELEPSGD